MTVLLKKAVTKTMLCGNENGIFDYPEERSII